MTLTQNKKGRAKLQPEAGNMAKVFMEGYMLGRDYAEKILKSE